MTPPTSRTQAAMALCQHCGMCCDGTLFAWVTVAPAEVAALEARGLPVQRRDDGTFALRQSCAALSGRSCTAYGDRPKPCREFRCHQLIALEEGEIELGEAEQQVDRAHEAIRALARTVHAGTATEPPLAGVVDAARRAVHSGTASEETKTRLVEVEALLARHFTGRGRR